MSSARACVVTSSGAAHGLIEPPLQHGKCYRLAGTVTGMDFLVVRGAARPPAPRALEGEV